MLPLRTFPRSDAVRHVADWLELQLLSGEPWRVNESNGLECLERHGLRDAYAASVPGAIIAMSRRATRLEDSYLLERSPGGLRRRQHTTKQLPYVSLLLLSAVDYEASNGALAAAATLFEQFCEGALPDSSGGQAIHFGWPSRSGRPEGFSDAIRWLASRLNVAPGSGYREPRRRDGGVDLVTWRHLPDGRTFDYRLVQCTLGVELLKKAREIDVEQWQRWIGFWESPRVAIAVPYDTVEKGVERREAEALGSLVYDRSRLVSLCAPNAARVMRVCNDVLKAVPISLAVDPA